MLSLSLFYCFLSLFISVPFSSFISLHLSLLGCSFVPLYLFLIFLIFQPNSFFPFHLPPSRFSILSILQLFFPFLSHSFILVIVHVLCISLLLPIILTSLSVASYPFLLLFHTHLLLCLLLILSCPLSTSFYLFHSSRPSLLFFLFHFPFIFFYYLHPPTPPSLTLM